MAGKFTNYTLQENVAWSSLLEKLRNHTHLSFRNRKRKDHSNTKPLLLFIKSEKPKITLSYLKKKHYKFQSKPKYSLHHCKTEMPHHAYHRSVHISKQEQDESMFLVLTLVMFLVCHVTKTHFRSMIYHWSEKPRFFAFSEVEYDNHVHGAYIIRLCIFERESCFSFHLRTISTPYQYPVYLFIRLLNSY